MKKFMFTTDFRANEIDGFKYICRLAKKMDVSITMFHAFGDGTNFSSSKINAVGSIAIEKLRKIVSDHAPEDCSEIIFNYVVSDEYPGSAIPKVAKEEEIDLVILGMKEESHFYKATIGNTALDLLMDIDSSVMIIPAGKRNQEIKRIGCTTDFKFRDITLLNLLKDIAGKIGRQTSIYCLHVFEKDEDFERVEKDIGVLYDIFKNRKGIPISFEVESGNLATTICNHAIEKDLDLLVMNSHQRTAIGKLFSRSTTRNISLDIRVPLLILKNL